VGNDPPRLLLKIFNHLFIVHVENHPRHHFVPMCHKGLIPAAIAAEFREVIAIGLAACKQKRETGKAVSRKSWQA